MRPPPDPDALRVVALDLDGTLLTSDKRVTERSREGLSAVAARGMNVVLATGRNLATAQTVAATLPCEATIIAHNGGLIARAGDGRVFRSYPLAPQAAYALCRLLRERGCAPLVYAAHDGGYRLFYDHCGGNPARARYLEANGSVSLRVPDVLDAVQGPSGERVLHVVAIEARQRVLALLREARGVEGALLTTSGGVYGGEYWFLEGVHVKASKLRALTFLCRTWRCTLAHVMAIGDNWNDTELLRRVAYGVAMGNAPEEVRQAADAVTASNDEEGVAKALAYVFAGKRPDVHSLRSG
jgi:hydroxymethylpyrimidine pyrophosphatase-like HAD family hydrolase